MAGVLTISKWQHTRIVPKSSCDDTYCSMIKHPYPKSTYCDVPVEAQTGVPLCRPLPKEKFPKPAPAPKPSLPPTGMTLSSSLRDVRSS